MVAFKLLLSLALVSVALARAVPPFPRATVDLSGDGLEKDDYNDLQSRIGEPFLLTCTFDPSLPEEEPNMVGPFRGHGPWKAEVSFGFSESSYDKDMKVFVVENQSQMQYVTENYFPGVNVYPVTEVEPGMGASEMRTNYTVSVLATDASAAGGQYKCAVKLSQDYRKAGVKFISNTISLR